MILGPRLTKTSAEGRRKCLRELKLREKRLKIFSFELRELLLKNELRKRRLQDFESGCQHDSPSSRKAQFAHTAEIDVFAKYVIERCYELAEREAQLDVGDNDACAIATSEQKTSPEFIAHDEHEKADLEAMERRQAVIDALFARKISY